jgi:hypothetical protein
MHRITILCAGLVGEPGAADQASGRFGGEIGGRQKTPFGRTFLDRVVAERFGRQTPFDERGKRHSGTKALPRQVINGGAALFKQPKLWFFDEGNSATRRAG